MLIGSLIYYVLTFPIKQEQVNIKSRPFLPSHPHLTCLASSRRPAQIGVPCSPYLPTPLQHARQLLLPIGHIANRGRKSHHQSGQHRHLEPVCEDSVVASEGVVQPLVDKQVLGKGKQLGKVQDVEQSHGGHDAGREKQEGEEKAEKLAPFPSKAGQDSYSEQVEDADKDAESAGIA